MTPSVARLGENAPPKLALGDADQTSFFKANTTQASTLRRNKMSNTQKSIQDNTYKTALTLLGPPQNIINSYGFANYLTKTAQ